MIKRKKIVSSLVIASYLANPSVTVLAEELKNVSTNNIKNIVHTKKTSNPKAQSNLLDLVYLDGSATSSGSGETEDSPVKTLEEALDLVADFGAIYVTGNVVISNDLTMPDKTIFIDQQKDKDKGRLTFEKKLYMTMQLYIKNIEMEFTSTDKDCIFLNGTYCEITDAEIIGKPNIFLGSENKDLDQVGETGYLYFVNSRYSDKPLGNITLSGKNGHTTPSGALTLGGVNVEGVINGENVIDKTTLRVYRSTSMNKIKNITQFVFYDNHVVYLKDTLENIQNLIAEGTIILKNGATLGNIQSINGEFTLDVEVPNGETLKEGTYSKSRAISAKINLSDNLIRSGYRIHKITEGDSVKFDIIHRNTVTNDKPVIKGLNQLNVKQGRGADLKWFVTASDFEDGDLTDSIVFPTLDTKSLPIGKYEVTYEVTDSDKNKVTKNRIINIISNEAPIIHGADNKTIMVDDVDTFDLLDGVTVTDDHDRRLKVSVNGQIEKPDAGTKKDYTITYSVTDYDGNTTTKDRVITVINNLPPVGGLDEVYVDPVAGSTLGLGTEINPISSFEKALTLVSDGGTIYITGNVVAPDDIQTPDKTIYIYQQENKPEGKLTFQKKLYLGNTLYLDEIKVEFTSNDKDCIFLNGNKLDIYDTEIIGEPNIFMGSDNKDTTGEGYIRIAHNTDSTNKIGNINLAGKNGSIDEAFVQIDSSNVKGILNGENVKYRSDVEISKSLNLQKIKNINKVLITSNNALNVKGGIENVSDINASVNTIISSDQPINILNNLNSRGTIKLKNGSNLTVGNDIKGDLKLDIELSSGNTLKEGSYLKSKTITGNIKLSDNLKNAQYRLNKIDGQDSIDFKIFHATTNHLPTITGLDSITIRKGKTWDLQKGVKAEDYEDGILTHKIVFPNNNLNTLDKGSYKIKYKVTDSDQNTTTIERVINVESNDAPKINGVKNTTIKIGDLGKFNLLDGIIVTDDHDNNLKVTSSGKIAKPSPGTNKSSTITYTVTDNDGNTTTVTRVITVTNQLPTISGLSDITIKKGQTADLRKVVTASDHEDGTLTSKIVYPNTNLATLPVGIHKITYKVTDSDNNSITETRIVNVEANSITKVDLIGTDRYETATKISKEGWKSAKTVILVNGHNRHLVDGLTASPLATALDAPILLSDNKNVPKSTIDEIKRLNPSKVIVIGGKVAINQSVIDQLNKISKNISVKRISGEDRYETSLNIAKELDTIVPIKKIYVGGGDGEADALSISSVAGKDKSPIILTPKNNMDTKTYNYLKGKKLSDAYFIGGTVVISDKVIKQVNGIVSKNVLGNRIAGIDRNETNAMVIKKFYPESNLDGVVIAKDLDLVDALAVGPLAAKRGIPVVLAQKNLSPGQETVLKNKTSDKLYQAGGGVSTSVLENLKKLLTD